MGRRRSRAEDVCRPLLSLWEVQKGFGQSVGCVATSFTFDAGFFEEELLGRFLGMTTDRAEDGRGYDIERAEKLSSAFACALVDRRKVGQPTHSPRWHLIPAQVPGEGTFHPKLSLLVWQQRVRVLVGSANLTEPGYRKNFEHMGVLEFSPEGILPRSLLAEVLGFLRGLADFCPSAVVAGSAFSKLLGFLDSVERMTAGWADGAWERGGPRVDFVPVLPGGDGSLIEQVRALWGARRPGPDVAYVLSPFFSAGAAAREVLDHLLARMADRGERELHVLARGTRQPDGTVALEAPEALRAALPRCARWLYLVDDVDGDDEARALHAKSLWLERGGRAVYVIGSSNFTAPGLGIATSGGRAPVNVEANLAYWPGSSKAFYRGCEQGYPPYEEVDAARVDLVHDAAEDSSEAGADWLPAAFRAAIYGREGDAAVLALHIDDDAPPGFTVREDVGEGAAAVLLDHAGWRALGEGPAVVPWPHARVPSSLRVDWLHEGETCTAYWVVDVRSAEDLPAPEALLGLSLDALMQILGSGLPLHEAVARSRRRRRAAGGDGNGLDPHKRVDTRAFLLRRMRRMAAALEGLRARLARPVATLDALAARLRGPVGPLALARRLAEEEREGAGFLIAEVAQVLGQVDWDEVGQLVGAARARAMVREVREELRALAAAHPGSPALGRYVSEVFAREAS